MYVCIQSTCMYVYSVQHCLGLDICLNAFWGDRPEVWNPDRKID